MTRTCVLLTVLGMLVYGCATIRVTPEKTQLQIREIQTRSYDTNDTSIVMKDVLDVLQDEGFIIKHANTDLGLLAATNGANVENKEVAIILSLLALHPWGQNV